MKKYAYLVGIIIVMAVSAATSAISPSGLDMPRGDLPGWKMIFSDDFTSSSIDTSKWIPYQGEAGGDPGGYFAQSHLSVSDGSFIISGFKDSAYNNNWITGGMNADLPTVYGKYLVRMRMDQGRGISMILLLWPQDESWPPEIDFAEDNGANPRNFIDATCWYTSQGQEMSIVKELSSIDTTQWHTYGVEWTSGKLVYTIDGQPWQTLSSQYVPSIPMHLCIQTQAWSCGLDWENCPDSTTPANVNMYVDWAVQYAPAAITTASNTITSTTSTTPTTTTMSSTTITSPITTTTTISMSSTTSTTRLASSTSKNHLSLTKSNAHLDTASSAITTTTSPTTTTSMASLLENCIIPGNDPACDEVSLSEVIAAINKWEAGDMSRAQVINLINSWSNSIVYPAN